MWVDWKDGAHLSRSATKIGSFSPLTRDGTTNNLGHVTLRPIDRDENVLRELVVEVAVAVAAAVTLKAMVRLPYRPGPPWVRPQ
ncbi:hypothetical protein ACQP2P_20775 [Dactylosporangium sp. CA-139114]|uniref:hypothetical protein n=1 Tax=Dactylosporangium sp. CA-139114 TaxID=3239931 RepID=UPI003D97167A